MGSLAAPAASNPLPSANLGIIGVALAEAAPLDFKKGVSGGSSSRFMPAMTGVL